MFGLDLIVAGWLTLASNEIVCEPEAKPKLSISPYKSNVKYDFTKSRDDLKEFNIDTIFQS